MGSLCFVILAILAQALATSTTVMIPTKPSALTTGSLLTLLSAMVLTASSTVASGPTVIIGEDITSFTLVELSLVFFVIIFLTRSLSVTMPTVLHPLEVTRIQLMSALSIAIAASLTVASESTEIGSLLIMWRTKSLPTSLTESADTDAHWPRTQPVFSYKAASTQHEDISASKSQYENYKSASTKNHRVFSVPQIPLIEDLTKASVPLGSNLLIEFDAASQWYNSCLTIAAGWVKNGGTVGYNGFIQPPNNVRVQLGRVGLDVDNLERNDRLRVYDWYTPTLGRKSKEKYGIDSLKVADQSIQFRLTEDDLKNPEDAEWPESLRIVDNFSTLARFNDEKSWIEFMLTRVYPIASVRKSTLIFGIMKGVHSEWAYKQLEGSADGIIEFRLEELERARDVVQIRTMRNVHFNRDLHELKIGENFEVTLEK